jgi:hypothetical protein
VILIFCLASVSPALAARVPRAVLVLHQWEATLPWYGTFFSAFNATLRADSPEPIAIFTEQLDLGHFKGAAQQDALHRYIVQKYSERETASSCRSGLLRCPSPWRCAPAASPICASRLRDIC